MVKINKEIEVETTTVKEKKQRMHSIVLKEKDKDSNWLSIDVDQIMPVFLFGDANPMIMGVVDDRAYFITYAQMNWFEQNYGVKTDEKIARAMHEEKIKNSKKHVSDVSFS